MCGLSCQHTSAFRVPQIISGVCIGQNRGSAVAGLQRSQVLWGRVDGFRQALIDIRASGELPIVSAWIQRINSINWVGFPALRRNNRQIFLIDLPTLLQLWHFCS
jgi:hypothetical protein